MPVIYGMYLWDVSLPGSEVISIAGVTMLEGGCDNFFDPHFNYIAFGMCHSKRGSRISTSRKSLSLVCDAGWCYQRAYCSGTGQVPNHAHGITIAA